MIQKIDYDLKLWRFIGLLVAFLIFAMHSNYVFAQSNAKQQVYSPITNQTVLKAIFADYNLKTGRVESIRNSQNQPALVSVLESKHWRQANHNYWVVLVGVAQNNDSDLPDKCGNCSIGARLVVLEKRASTLSRVDITNPNELTIGAHENMSLNLVSYPLNAQETLIGVKLEHQWMMTYDYYTDLTLYRLHNGRISSVFEHRIIDRDYPNESFNQGDKLLKTVSSISLKPTPHSNFFLLLVQNRKYQCTLTDLDETSECDSHKRIRTISSNTEKWFF